MAELAFRDGVMEQIRAHETRYEEGAYLFVLAALAAAVAATVAGAHSTPAIRAAQAPSTTAQPRLPKNLLC